MQKFLVDTTPTLRTYPRVSPAGGWLRRQPTSATVKITTPNVTDDSFSSATVQSYSTTLSAAVEEGDTEVTVSAATGFVNACRYLIGVEGDDDVEVEARAKTSSVDAAATYPALFDESVVDGSPALGSNYEGESFTLTDATGQSVTFEFDTGGGVTGGRTAIGIGASDNASAIATAFRAAINAVGAGLRITAAAPFLDADGFQDVVLTQDDTGPEGNTSVTSSTAFLLGQAAFAGGTDAGPTVLLLAEPLPRDIATGATVKSWSITKALTAQQTDTAGNGVARWRAVIDGETYQWDEPFRIVHRIPVSPLTPSRLMQAYPVMQTLRPEKDTDLEETIRLAWEHEVLPMLEVKGFHEDYIESTDALEPVHALACVLMLARPSPSFPRETLATLEALQLAKVETMFARTSWYAAPAPETTPQPAPEVGTPEPQFALVSR